MTNTGFDWQIDEFMIYCRSDSFDAEEAFQLVHIFLVVLVFSELLDPIVYPFQLFCKIVVAKKILVQCFLIDTIKLQTAQPVYMRLRPVALGPIVLNAMSQAEGKNLLLDLQSLIKVVIKSNKTCKKLVCFLQVF